MGFDSTIILYAKPNANKLLEFLAVEWEATKKLGDQIESDDEEDVQLIVCNEGTYCPLLCELPLRWGLPCCYWMYPAFVDAIPIPSSLIHPRLVFDGPDHLTSTWNMLRRYQLLRPVPPL